MSPTLVRLLVHECVYVCLDRPCVPNSIYAEKKLDAIFTTTLK